jgi:hypothetical protein
LLGVVLEVKADATHSSEMSADIQRTTYATKYNSSCRRTLWEQQILLY